MKKIIRYSLALCLSISFGLSGLQASSALPTTPLTTEQAAANPRLQELNQRLEQIQAMDKSQMSASERKALRKETRQIKKAISGGVYVSAGALIVLLIILILVL